MWEHHLTIFLRMICSSDGFSNFDSTNPDFYFFFTKMNVILYLKFGLSEKHTKFEKNLPHDLDIY